MWTTQPWKTQYWQREIMNKMYRNNIDGLCGNDDCGQMSAWYILSAMGFYPVCPGTDQYVLGAPYLPYMKVFLENGKTFEVRADKVSDKEPLRQIRKTERETIYQSVYYSTRYNERGRADLRNDICSKQEACL